MKTNWKKIIGNQKGAVLIWFVLFLPILIGMAAMAIDVSRLTVAKNELQNAADAGALAAASLLYNSDGTQIDTSCNQVGIDAATANKSENLAVEVSAADVQRGHWSFGIKTPEQRGFTPNPSTTVVSLWNVSTADLDANTNFINAVQVTAHRKDTPIYSYFARIFKIESWVMQATAVAYIGFAGSLMPQEVDQPIAICKESLLIDGKYTCSVGRMINSGTNEATSETGGWTDFYQGPEKDPCNGGTNAKDVASVVCGNGNPTSIQLGVPMATNGGEINSAFPGLYDCWVNNTNKNSMWQLTLPVVECNDNNLGPCNKVVGAVTLNVIWILEKENKIDDDAPFRMEYAENDTLKVWENNSTDGKIRWNDFVTTFDLRKADGSLALYSDNPQESGFKQKSLYFIPDCTYHEPAGATGGENFGILAKIPVLVD